MWNVVRRAILPGLLLVAGAGMLVYGAVGRRLSVWEEALVQEEVTEEAAGGGGVWVVAEVVDGAIAPVTLEAIGAARNLADSLGAYVYGVLLGETDLAQTLYQAGADGVAGQQHAFQYAVRVAF